MNKKKNIEEYFNDSAKVRQKWYKRNYYYNKLLIKYFSFLVKPGSSVLEIGCGLGDLLNGVKPRYAVGIDISEEMIKIAGRKFPNINFIKNV